MKTIVITQARTGSTRLPNKVLLKIDQKSLLQIHIDRIKKAKSIDEIYIATTENENDIPIVILAKQLGVKLYRGSEEDVLDRFYKTAKLALPDYIVRLTSDCPLIDGTLIDEVVKKAQANNFDYYANVMEERYPDGQDIEVFKFSALEKAWREASLKSEREHVTSYIRNNSSYKGGVLFTSGNHGLDENYNQVRLTVDEPEDVEVIKRIIGALGLEKDWKTYADYYIMNKKIHKLNSDIIRNEGYSSSLKKD
jgi:spore coat polysaccharide biosynthesis protein SpsF (cytidylyltransferase family)